MFRTFRRDERGVAAVEAGLLTGVFVFLIGGGLEMGLAYHQKSSAEMAARHGARMAAINAPVSPWLANWSGMGSGVRAGDPLPDYSVTCEGATRRCSRGGFDRDALDALVAGATADCGSGDAEGGRAGQGMCDFVSGLDRSNVRVRYEGSGLGTAGNPADPLPVITVTVTGLEYDFIFLEYLLPGLRTMGDVSASAVAEDLRGGA